MLSWSDAPGIAGLIFALITGYFTYRASHQENINTSRRDAVEGYDKLADDLRTDLTDCKTELREIKATLTKIERANHELTYSNDKLAHERDGLLRENQRLREQLGMT
jgi:cell shape-determining protein MreC